MSRDYTPRQLHMADRVYQFSKNKLVIENPAAKKTFVKYDPLSVDAERWPNAYFLAEMIWGRFRSEPEKLDRFEKALSHIVSLDDEGRPFDNLETEFDRKVAGWYAGELDPSFYYGEENSRIMIGIIEAYLSGRREE